MIETPLKQYACQLWSITEQELTGPGRMVEAVHARFQMYTLLKLHYKSMSLKTIGKKYGNRDHATIIHGLKKHEIYLIENDWRSIDYREKFTKLLEYYGSIKDLKEYQEGVVADIMILQNSALIRIKNVIDEALKQKTA